MLERSRILKQEQIMDNYKINGMYSLNENDVYQREILDIVSKLFSENPNCFDKDVIDYKISLSDKLVKKYNQDINKYYHYTFKDNGQVVGIRYKRLTDNIITLVSSYLRGKVVLQIVKYETAKENFSELRSLVTYDRQTNEVRIVNMSVSKADSDIRNIYYWSNDNECADKVLINGFNIKKR